MKTTQHGIATTPIQHGIDYKHKNMLTTSSLKMSKELAESFGGSNHHSFYTPHKRKTVKTLEKLNKNLCNFPFLYYSMNCVYTYIYYKHYI